MKRIFKICFWFSFFAVGTLVGQAETLTGTVHNATAGKLSAGDDVLLVRLGEGMEDESRTKTDANGAFTLNMTSPNAQHFVRVIHQGVNYDQSVTGPAPLEIVVYDAVSKIPGLSGAMGIVQAEADAKALKLTEMYVISNTSNPPVTQSRADNYEISLPAKAVLDSTEVRSNKGMWVKSTPTAVKGREGVFDVNFPIRPGDTLFKFVYHLPYSGRTTLRLHLPYPILRFGVMHPASMRFKALAPNTFRSPGPAGGLDVEAAVKSPLVGDVPPFEISGTGVAPPHGNDAARAPQPASPPSPAPNDSAVAHSPNTAESEEKSQKELWLLVGGIVAILAVFGVAVWRMRKRGALVLENKSADTQDSVEALKEELFQLESDRVHGSISAEEYAATKDALTRSIQHALARKK